MYCMKCGKELKDGELCECMQQVNEANQETVSENANIAENTATNENSNQEESKKIKKNTFTNFIKNFGLLFAKPSVAIKDAVTNKRWVNAILYVLIFSFIIAATSTVSNVWDSLKYYNSAVDAAQENYDSAKKSFSLNSSYYNSRRMEIAENSLEVAKERRIERLTSASFIFGTIGRFIQRFITPILSVIIVTLLLLLMGKMFKGKGTFGGTLAGIGLSYSVHYVSTLILPVLAKIPFLGAVFSAAITGIAAVYGVLVFLTAKESFEIDDSKNILSIFFALSVATLVSTLILSI